MKKTGWIARCTAMHLLLYIAFSLPFGFLVSRLPSLQTETLRFFEMFIIPHPGHMVGQLLRGLVLALVLMPFHSLFFGHRKGRAALFWALWGLSMIGSVEPLPGSIEGWIYTMTTPFEHLLILALTLLQAFALTFLLAKAEEKYGPADVPGATDLSIRPRLGGMLRFMLLHVVTYLAAGLLFFNMQDYTTAFESSRFFAHYRPLDGPIVQTFAIPLQIPRGILMALWMAPFIAFAKQYRHGWLHIFLAIFGLTALATHGFIPLTATHIAEGGMLLEYILIGTPEIFVQMLLFSLLVFIWEKRVDSRAVKLKEAVQ